MYLEKVKALCARDGVSISRLEKDCSIGNGTIREWDKSTPTIDNLKKICTYFNVPIAYFIEDVDMDREVND